MLSKVKHHIFLLAIFTFVISLFPIANVSAKESANNFPSLISFIQTVKDGNAN